MDKTKINELYKQSREMKDDDEEIIKRIVHVGESPMESDPPQYDVLYELNTGEYVSGTLCGTKDMAKYCEKYGYVLKHPIT